MREIPFWPSEMFIGVEINNLAVLAFLMLVNLISPNLTLPSLLLKMKIKSI